MRKTQGKDARGHGITEDEPMGLRINNNVSSLSALNKLRANDRAQQQSLERLSSGLRINRASDDPSGLVVSEKLRGQISSLGQALQNTQNDINLLNTAEAALGEIGDILVDMRSSVVFALNTGFASGDQIRAEQEKMNQSLVAIDRIAASTRFANRNLLNGESDFQVQRTAGGAFDELTVRSARLAPGATAQNYDVNISQLAERATLVSNVALSGEQTVVEGSGGFATLRVSGAKGSADIQLGAGSTVQDLVSAVNQNTSSTGVYAAGFKPMALDSGSSEFVVRGAGNGIQLNGVGQDMVFGLRVGANDTQTLVVNSGADSVVSLGELETALRTIDPNFEVFAKDGDMYIRNADSSFEFKGVENVRTYTLTAQQIATMFQADEGGSAAATFGDGTAIGFDIDGDGSIVGAAEQFTFANTGGSGVDTEADKAALVAAVRGMSGWGGNVAVQTDAAGNLVVIDTSGSTMGAMGAGVGITNSGGDDDVVAAALNGYKSVSSFTSNLDKLEISGSSGKSHDEAVSFINFEVPSDFISAGGELRISTSAVSGGTLNFTVTDSVGAARAVTVSDADADGYITLADIQTGLNAIAADVLGNDDARVRYQAYFDKEGGLTIVDRFGGNFTVQDVGGGTPDTDLTALFGKASYASTANTERLALYSTEFGSGQVVSIQDVTAPTSGVQFKGAIGGLAFTGDGRDGLGVLAGTSTSMAALSGGAISGAGKDLTGNISGMAFAGSGFNVNFVTSTLDVSFTLGEHFGMQGDAGRQADAGRFGFAASARTSGASALNGMYAERQLPNGYLDSVQFTVAQGAGSGMRFQIRETNNATDSISIGIRQVSTATLGRMLTPEGKPGDASYDARFNGGSLNTLRTGGGNDLMTDPNNALEIVDRAIDQVTGLRAYLGSVAADTLQRNMNSVSVAVENLTGAQSAIRDLDFAEETTNFTKAQIMFQASTSVLAAANSTQQAVLSLLQGI